ncbi:glutamyl-tRNA reductase [Nocardioides sp. AX2bis]|uniref:glutamyl-tRNA reductase n=1 Tax=Nocardioides sp. AX2bis TaxID=2653157 RepID=UPI0012F0B844|nr:glutamyl-tRNA reductase [Nocardioides sp. AX2bis]VXC21193.1 Glutamyl-tRNA reductase 1 [Nocardioides sp. AX2bis]
MSVLVVGISHSSAPVSLLEKVALSDDAVHKLVQDVSTADRVSEATVIATCNRVEIYADVDRFHGSVETLSRMLIDQAGEDESMLPHLYVHYDDGAVSHLFQVAAGLDSMAVGEGQILGQTRKALRTGQELGTVGPSLNVLFQQALRVGKRSRAETDIDLVAPSLVSVALARAEAQVGAIAGKDVVVVGAGSMAGLAVATVARAGAGRVTVVNRSAERADRLAAEHGPRADGSGPGSTRALRLADLPLALGEADVVITCTGATGVLVSAAQVSAARQAAGRGAGEPLCVLDLALPRDVEPAVADLPGVGLVGLSELAETLQHTEAGREVEQVRDIVTHEVTSFLAARRQASVTPTVVALRSMATGVVDTEMGRLDTRLPGLEAEVRAEVLHTLRRVADKLLHEPTVRVKELADEQGAVSYAAALAELFSLDPEAVDAVTRPKVGEEGPS